MNWLAVFFYILAMVQTYAMIAMVSRIVGTPVNYLKAAGLCLAWPTLPVVFLYKIVTDK